MASRLVLKFSDFLAESSLDSEVSADELQDLASIGVVSWFDATRVQIEQIIGAKLVEVESAADLSDYDDVKPKHTEVKGYRIIDPETEHSDRIFLYVNFFKESGKPTAFCFKAKGGWTIPLSIHSKYELEWVRSMNTLTKHRFFFIRIHRLTREAYLSAVANRDMIYLPTQEQ
jgi:hypothetical protein